MQDRAGPIHAKLPRQRSAEVTDRPEGNLGALAVILDDEQRARLHSISAIELGFPHDLVAQADDRSSANRRRRAADADLESLLIRYSWSSLHEIARQEATGCTT
jgi:hypothetical protein